VAEFLILRHDDGDSQAVNVVQADTAAELRELVKQGYQGPGRYAICRWDNRREFDLRPGPVQAADPPPAAAA
jgi:hypothetical protein